MAGRTSGESKSQGKEMGLIVSKAVRQTGYSHSDLAKLLGVSPSYISLIAKGLRIPSPDLLSRLAAALCPKNTPLEDFAKQLFFAATGNNEVPEERVQSVSQRMVFSKLVRVFVVSNAPFASEHAGEYTGFAVDLFKALAAVMGIRTAWNYGESLAEVETKLQRGEADVIVSGFLPTFQRGKFMSFSRPFPYLRVSLSGVVRNDARTKVSVQSLLARDTSARKNLKVLLVESEVGEQFARSFLHDLFLNGGDQVVSEPKLDSELLAKRLINKEGDLLLADLATCQSVVNKYKNRLSPLTDEAEKRQGFPVLAKYPIVFGLPKNDPEWKDTIDRAFNSLMSEGLEVLLSLYESYLNTYPDFADFLTKNKETDQIIPDETVTSGDTRESFEFLFDKHFKKNKRQGGLQVEQS